MAILISKGNSNYVGQTWVNNTTVISEENIKPIDSNLIEVSEKLKNSTVTVNLTVDSWETSGEYFKVVIQHPFETLDVSYKAYRFDTDRYNEEAVWCSIISNSTIEIYSDEAIQGKVILTFDLLK